MVYTLTLESTSWLATLTGESTVTVYTNGSLHERDAGPAAFGNAAQFSAESHRKGGNGKYWGCHVGHRESTPIVKMKGRCGGLAGEILAYPEGKAKAAIYAA